MSKGKLPNCNEDWETPQVEKSSQDDGWQESCNLPRGWRSKDKQSNFKGDRGIPHVEKTSQVDGWQESCDLPRGWMSKEKQQNFLELNTLVIRMGGKTAVN